MPKDSPAARRLRRLKRRLTVANRANRQLVKLMWQSQQVKTLDTIDVPAPIKANYYEETPDEPMADTVDAVGYVSEDTRTLLESGLCCLSRHANAVAPWTCDCPCHSTVEPTDASAAVID